MHDAGAVLSAEDFSGDDITRREFGQLVLLRHEALARAVEQNRAFATHRFTYQRQWVLAGGECGRVKLHELHVGHARAGTMRDGETVACRHRRIGREAENLTQSTRRHHHRFRVHLDRLAIDGRAHADATSAHENQIEHARRLEHLHVRRRLHAFDQCA